MLPKIQKKAITAIKYAFENYPETDVEISEQEYFDNGILMVAMVRAGVELAFEAMTASGIIDESAYYESLHELQVGERISHA